MITSSKARKQRKAHFNAPVHIRGKKLSSHLSADLREKYGVRSVRVIRGDSVMVVRGSEDIRGTEGKVLEVFTKDGKVSIEGITLDQADGTAVARPIHASNLVVTKLDLSDEWRKDKLLRKKEAAI